MIKSMTGFGKGEAKSKFGRFTVEVRSVNHRYFDVSSRIPNNISLFEDRIKNYLNKHIKRGKVNVAISIKKNGRGLASTKLDDEAIDRYYRMLARVKRKFKLSDNITLSHILSFPDVVIQEQPDYDPASIWPVLEEALGGAAIDCNKMREREGKTLHRDLMQRINKTSFSVNKISRLAPNLIARYRHKLNARMKELMKGRSFNIDRSRLETEIAIFAKQSDVSEEITRAKSHLHALRMSLASNKETGRRLDFILQELQREINTLGSKAGGVKISQLVVDIKSEIEKMREQAQNVE